MYLYNLTLQRSQGIVTAIHGNFSGSKLQEIVVSRGKVLELFRHDPNTGKIFPVLSTEVFGIIRSLMPFRLTGGTKDYVVAGSDSGRIVILEYIPAKNMFERIHQETFGKSGCRRIVPGQYLAVDPKGRAVMIGAVEKQKLVYILNRDAQARLTISSPLEAHKSNTLVYHMVGVDVGFENPSFACLEIDYEEADGDPTGEAALKTQQLLTYYELDLGLNHVVRKYSEQLEEHANFLISVPGGHDGPSGVLICSENYITYKNLGDQPDIRCPIPRRRCDLDDPERGMIFVCSATHKTKSMFFFLAQTEQGDIFKITLETDEDMVTEIRLKYFDTVPVATSMCVLKSGFLFVAAEFGNHHLYQIAHLGDDDGERMFSSANPLEEGDTFHFSPRELKNLVMVDEMDSLSPIITAQIADLANEDTPQLFTLCGRGPRSTLRVLRHGLEVSEMAVSELPGNPNAVWTVKKHTDGRFLGLITPGPISHIFITFGWWLSMIFYSHYSAFFVEFSLLLLTGGIVLGSSAYVLISRKTKIYIFILALFQIYPEGIRHIRSDKRVNEWKTPGKKNIVKCAVNQRQVVIALTGGELVYFEMDPTGQLNEYTERKELSSNVVCMALGRVPAGELRSRFLAVGLSDNTVRIISLDPNDCLSPLSMQAFPAPPESLCIIEMGGSEAKEETGETATTGGIYLNIGLQNGVLLRTVLDPVTGDLSDTRTRYLGSRPVKLFRISMQGSEAVLAMSSRTWLSYTYQSRFHLTPLSYETLEYASGFASEQCPEGIVAISTNTLRILALEKLGAVFNQVAWPLQYTPRKFVIHPESNNLIIIETDHNAYTEETKQLRKQHMAEELIEAADEDERELAAEMAAQFLNEDRPETIFGAPKAGLGMWASVVRIINPITGENLEKIALEQNEAAHSVALVKFSNRPEDTILIVGIAKDLVLNPRSVTGGELLTYQVTESGTKLELLHKTPVEEVPGAITPFQGRVLIGVGKYLRIYDLGKKKLLRKCENKHIPNAIVSIHTMGNRVFVGDVQESIHFVRYRRPENQLIIFCDDTNPRWVTCSCILDYNTVAIADKFGNATVIRLPSEVSDDVDEDPTGNKALWDRGLLNGASQKADVIANFHVGEVVTSLQKATLIPGGSESLTMLWNVIDGDLCEVFNSMEPSKQKSIAEELEDRSSNEVSKKLEDIRTRYAF
uniref:DNA damage-binding protein 1 n=1 Tax=Biomphalaria glabrata TaxID=6526 RepID=A0A2C9JNG1_BIOGL